MFVRICLDEKTLAYLPNNRATDGLKHTVPLMHQQAWFSHSLNVIFIAAHEETVHVMTCRQTAQSHYLNQCIHDDQINKIRALVQIVVLHLTGDKPFS